LGDTSKPCEQCAVGHCLESEEQRTSADSADSVLADFLEYDVSDIGISVTNWPVFVYCYSKLLKTVFARLYVCVRGIFISAGLANMVLVTSLADFNEVRFTCCYSYIFASIYPESYLHQHYFTHGGCCITGPE